MTTETIYSRPDFAEVDIGAEMRVGHPYIAHGDQLITDRVLSIAQTRQSPLTVLEIGSGSGCLLDKIMHAVPGVRLIANEVEPFLVEQAKRRFEGTGVQIYDQPFETFSGRIDILISWGSHHHLSNRYLAHAGKLLGPDGVLILGDEFCPDYLDGERDRIRDAQTIYFARGHLLTTHSEVREFLASDSIPNWSLALERRRQEALWTWYKHVIDYALARRSDVVVATELQIARDDLETGFAGEHKVAPDIVVRDLELNGFVEHSRTPLEAEPALASFIIYEFSFQP